MSHSHVSETDDAKSARRRRAGRREKKAKGAAMKTEVTPEMVREYQTNGFVRVDDFLDAAELEQWRVALDEAVEQRGGIGPGGLKLPTVDERHPVDEAQWTDTSRAASGPYTQRLQLWRTHDHFRKVFLDPKLGEMVTKLGCQRGMRIWHDQTLIKEPWAPPSTFHLDNVLWSFHHHESISIWVALDDVTLQNGCMNFIPGSHREAVGHHQDYERVPSGHAVRPGDGTFFDRYPEWKARKAVPVEMKAGSCTFHNGLTLHGAGYNMTPGRRRAMTCAYMPDGSIFNGQQNVLPQSYFDSLEIGQPLENNDLNPLVYSVPRM